MREPTQEEIKEFWEGCGFYSKEVTRRSADFNGIYMDRDGNFKKTPDAYNRTLWHDPEIDNAMLRDYWYAENGLPPIDLNSLFKHAVPKLWVCNLTIEEGIFALAAVGHPNLGENRHLEEIKDGRPDIAFALALFWALHPVITGKEVKP